jgi:hypothetical protein
MWTEKNYFYCSVFLQGPTTDFVTQNYLNGLKTAAITRENGGNVLEIV